MSDEKLIGVIANEMNRLGYGHHETHAESILCAINRAQGEPVAWIKPDVAKTLTKDECCYAFGSQNPKGTLIPLYAGRTEDQ